MKERKPMSVSAALARAAALCSVGEQCASDLSLKMRRSWGLSASEADEVVARLRAERFLDDARYARAFVHDKLAFNRWGRLRLRRELRAKRIAAEAIDAALAAIDEVVYRDTLLALLRAKLPQGGDTSPQARARLLRNGMSHGFETSLVIDCLRQLALDTHDLEPLIDDGAEGLD